jgi:hypothetical protein
LFHSTWKVPYTVKFLLQLVKNLWEL